MINLILALVAFGASTVGAICGIGGGVVIKPVLDVLNVAGVSTINFLSGCTVLAMSCYSVVKSLGTKSEGVELKTGTPLAIGAALGGVGGKVLFDLLRGSFAQPERVSGYQAVGLGLMTFITLLYTAFQSRVKTHRVESRAACVFIGLLLGVTSSFLGIGGGPINLMVLYFFFSMTPKAAARNSLYIILVSQSTSLLTTLVTRSVPPFQPVWLVLMAGGGILGGMAGRKLNKKLGEEQVSRLFMGLLLVIMGISVFNAYRSLV